MRYPSVTLGIALALLIRVPAQADCPLDHLAIGCNADGVAGTDDDKKLFIDCTDKYRHSDPNSSAEATWRNWFYPLYYNERYDRYQVAEPGFGIVESDPNRELTGTGDVDYRIIIECVSITLGFTVRNTALGIILDEPGDSFSHSSLPDPHLHLEYRAPAPAGATELHWITFRMYDEIDDADRYGASERFTVVFVREPLAGDLVVDGRVDMYDLAMLGRRWSSRNASITNDYYERADANRDGRVDFIDLALLTANWLNCLGPQAPLLNRPPEPHELNLMETPANYR